MRRILWWTFVAPLGFFALCAIVLFLFKEKTRRDLDAYKASLVAKGETLDLAVLAPKSPRETDAPARQFISACEKLEKFAKDKKHPNPLPDKLTKEGKLAVTSFSDTARFRGMDEKSDRRRTWDELAKGFEEYENLIAPVRDMARRENLEFYPDCSSGGLIPMPYIGNFLRAMMVLHGDALIQLKKGNPSRAVENVEAIIRMGQALQKQPVLICRMCACSHYKEAASITWQIVQSGTANTSQLLELQQLWETVDPMANLATVLRLERAFTADQFANPNILLDAYFGEEPYQINLSKMKLIDQAETLGRFAAWRWVLIHIDELQTLKSLEQMVRAIEDYQRTKNFRALDAEQERIFRHARASWLFVNRVYVPSTTPVITRCVESQASVNLVIAALALERFRLATGAYPDSLEMLVPGYLSQISTDPYASAPLRYRKTGDKFLLYSISDNFTDDGGEMGSAVIMRSKTLEGGTDIVWPKPAEKMIAP